MTKYVKMIICIICCGIIVCSGFAGTFAIAAENYNLSRLDQYLIKYKAAVPVPGFSVAVVSKDKIVFSKGYGVEIAGTNKPMTKDSISAIGSLTKSFTSLAIMQLVEQGKLSLDDTVVKHLPWFRTLDKENSDKITIGMLLSNTSGIPSMDRSINLSDTSEDAMERAVKNIASFPLSNMPGEAFEYSNEGFNTAGLIIEKVSGLKYSDYMQKYVLEPLKMSKSTTDIRKFDELKVLYGHNPGIDNAIPAGKFLNSSNLAAGSEFRSTAEDLGHYLIALLNGGKYEGKSVISQKSIDTLWNPVVTSSAGTLDLSDDKTMQYCLGWMAANIDGRRIVKHGGNTLSASSYTYIYPEKKIAVSVLLNINSVDMYKYPTIEHLANNILHIVCGDSIKESLEPGLKDPSVNNYELPRGLNKKYVGEYLSGKSDVKLKIYEDAKGDLTATLIDSRGTSVFAVDFASPSAVCLKNISYSYGAQFMMSPEGEITGISMGLLGNFIKQFSDKYAKFKKAASNSSMISMYIPNDYTITWNKDSFTINGIESKYQISGILENKRPSSYNNAVSKTTSGETVIKESIEHIEGISGNMYREKIYTVQKGNSTFQKILIYTENGDNCLYMTSVIPYSEASNFIREVLIPLMSSISIK